MQNSKYLLDTNVIIYSLKSGLELPEAHYFITEITKNEILSYKKITDEDRVMIEEIFNQMHIIHINNTIKENASKIKQKYNLTIDDSIICASAYAKDLTLITNDQLLHKVKEIQIEPFYFVQ